MASEDMSWAGFLALDVAEVEDSDSQADALYRFVVNSRAPNPGDCQWMRDPASVEKVFAVVRTVLKVKGEEAQVAFEELSAREAVQPTGTAERDLLDQIVHLEKEVRHRDAALEELRERNMQSPGNEARYLREQLEDVKHDLSEKNRLFDQERSENERLSSECSAERLRSRQLEREVDRLKQNLEDYRRQLEWHRERDSSSGSQQRQGEPDFREKLRRKDLEIAEQLDKMEELLNARDGLERQLHELTVQLGHVEEQRLMAIRDMEKMRVALVEADQSRDQTETRNKILAGQLLDLEGRLQEHAGADDQIMAMLSSKSREWESRLSSKQAELDECHKEVVRLEGQLRVAQRDTSRAAIIKLKKQLQERGAQVEALQEQLLEAAHGMESLSSQLQQSSARTDASGAGTALLQQVSELQAQVERLQRELEQEVLRREEAESSKEEKDVELTQALGRLGEYERGEYGLHEAVLEIKMKKEEITVRDKDIAELTQQVNQLEHQLNQWSDENEALRGQLGVGLEEEVDLRGLKQRKKSELEQLRADNRMLEREVERLEEEKLALRKQLMNQTTAKGESAAGQMRVNVATHPGTSPSAEQERILQELTAQVKELRESYDTERHQREAREREAQQLYSQLRDCQEQSRFQAFPALVRELREASEVEGRPGNEVKQYETALRELSQAGQASGEEQRTAEALEKLITVLEARGADGKFDVSRQLKSEVSQLTGQNVELRSRLQGAEQETKKATRRLERRLVQVESLQNEVETLRKASCGFQPVALPAGMPPTSNDIIAGLNEHLIRVLSELRAKERVVVESQGALERVQRKLAVIIHQQGVLYHEHQEAKGAWQSEREGLVQERAGLVAQREKDQLQLQEFKNLQEVLSADPDSQRQRMGELSRKVTILRVNEKTLSRRFTLLHEAEAALRKENGKLQQDLVTLERATTERMGYLERFKEAAQFKLAGLQHQLSESIPSSSLERANREHEQLVAKYQHLLQRQTADTADARALDQAQAEVRALNGQLESVKQELATEKQKCHLLEQTSTSATTDGRRGPGGSEQGLAERLATLEMKELNERQRADLAAARLKQAQEVVSQLEGRNAHLEEKFGELSAKLLQTQAKENELEDKLTNCLTQAEKAALESHIQDLMQTAAKLKLENSQLKEVAEIARQQSVAMESWQKSHDIELSSIRHQLLDLEMQSDEKTVIGKLHHQLVTLQVSEALAVRKLEEANGKLLKIEGALLRSEHERDELSSAIFQVRAEAQGKIRQLRCSVQSLRRQFAGALPLSRQEKHAELVAKLREDKLESERLKEETRKEREAAEDELCRLQLQHSNLQELIAALGDSKNVAARMTEWHAKLGEMRLQELKLTRTVQRLKDQVRHLEGLVTSSEKAFAKLEHDLVTVTKDYESSQLSWEQRELELEQQLEHLRQQQRKAASAAQQLQDSAGSMPDPLQPVSSQLEQAISTLRENSHTIAELRQQVRRSEEHADKLEKALTRAQSELLQRDREMSELGLQLSRAQVEGAGTARSDHMRSHDFAGGEESRKALKVALETIEQLRALVSQKGSLAEKYQRLLQEARRELQAATEAHKTETASLLQQIHSQADTAFSKLKEAALTAVNVPPPELPTDKQLARLQELEELVVEQEGANTGLAEQVKQVRRELARAEQAWQVREAELRRETEGLKKTHQATVDGLQQSVRERSSRVAELEQELEVVEGELSAAQEAASHAPFRSMRNLVEKLRGQLVVKEKQHKALSAALLQVRSDLVETAQQTVEGQSRQEVQEANLQQLLDRKTAQMQDRIQELSGRMDKLRARLEESQARERQAVEQVQRLEEELLEKTSVASRLETELGQQKRSLEQARGREEARALEVKELRSRLEQLADAKERGQNPRASAKQGEATVAAEVSSQVDSKHSSVEVLRWEEGKRWQRRVEQLKARLSEKGKEVEAGHKQIASLKEMLGRADREKAVLQSKLRAYQRSSIEVATSQKSSAGSGKKDEVPTPDPEEQHLLRSRIFELENQVQQLQRDVNEERLSEPRQLEARNSQLLKTIEALETQLQKQNLGSSSDLRCLREAESRLQGELLQSQRENMRLRFECEQASLEVPRLKARVEDQQSYIEALKSASGTVQAEGNVRPGDGGEAEGGGHRVVELERVITAMRKVVERLQRENESLRRLGGKQTRAQETTQVRLEAENKRLKAELEKLLTAPSAAATISSTKSPYAKIVAENERIRRELKKEIEKSEQFQLSLTTLEVQNSKLQEELLKAQGNTSADAAPSSEQRIEILQAEVEKKTAMLMEVKKHLREAAERERAFKTATGDSQLAEHYAAVLKEKEALQQQVAHLRKELDAFDPSFFEEIEDLKYNHQEAVRKNIQFEELLAKLAQQHGFSVSKLDLPGSRGPPS